MSLRLTATARRELATQIAYIAALAPAAATQLASALRRAFDLLESDVADGPPLVLRSGRPVRRWLVPPLILFYSRQGDTVVIWRVRHQAQRPVDRA